MVDHSLDQFPVAVIGAGPIGLAAAAHLAERNVPFVVLEAGDTAAAAVRSWSHVQLFSPWEYNTDPAARRLLAEAAGRSRTPRSCLPAETWSSSTCSHWPNCPPWPRTSTTARPSRL